MKCGKLVMPQGPNTTLKGDVNQVARPMKNLNQLSLHIFENVKKTSANRKSTSGFINRGGA
jgi:hypothetical protein